MNIKSNVVGINLDDYPGLLKIWERDSEKLSETIKAAVKKAENHVVYGEPRETISKQVFGMTVADAQKLFTDVFFDHKLIIEAHHDPKEKELMRILGEENHPLAVFLGKTQAYTATGEKIDRKKFTSSEDVKDFFQDYLYALRYCSMKDLTDFLMIGDFDLIENLKLNNVKALLAIQPSLAYQKDNNIPIGKRIPGTGFFDCGEQILYSEELCTVCKNKNSLHTYQNYRLCSSCKAGIKPI